MTNFNKQDQARALRAVWLLGISAAALLILATPLQALAKDDCAKYLESSSSFWSSDSAFIEVKGQKLPLAFSFDSETTITNTYKFIAQDPKALNKLKAFFARKPVSRAELVRLGDWSDEEFATLGLSEDVDKNLSEYRLTDLTPNFFAYTVRSLPSHVESQTVVRLMTSIMTSMYKRMNLPYKAEPDGLTPDYLVPETKHISYELSPRNYWDAMIDFPRLIENPQTHFHLGIPAAVPAQKFYAIARAIETLVILTWAHSLPDPKKVLTLMHGSSLSADPAESEGKRGMVLYKQKEFPKPIRMHNLEIRKYLRYTQGLWFVAFAAELARGHENLREIEIPRVKVQDPYTGNLWGALYYSGHILAQSEDPGNNEAGAKLIEFAERIATAKNISPEIRKEISAYFEAENALDRLTPSVFFHSAD